MSTTLSVSYQVDVFGGTDDFSPDKVIGQSDDDLERMVFNNTWMQSKLNERILYSWVHLTGWASVVDATFLPLATSRATQAKGRTRISLWTDAVDVQIRMGIYQLDLSTQIGAFVTNVHGAVRSRITATFTGNTQLPIIAAFEVMQNDPAGGQLYGCRAKELDILQVNL